MKRVINILIVLGAALLQIVSCTPADNAGAADRPVITIENNGLVDVSFEGGEISVAYTIDKPVEGGELYLELAQDSEWIEYTVSPSQITFVVEENAAADTRYAMITASYSYGDQSVKNYLTLTQQPCEYLQVYDTDFGGCIWYDNYYSVDKTLTKYVLMLETEEGIVVVLDLSAPENTEDMLPPAGEYTSYEYRLEQGYAISVGPYASTYICQYYDSDNYDYIAIGGMDSEVEISRDGDIFTVRAHIVDDIKGDEYLVRYTGPIEAANGLEIFLN